MLCWLQLTDTVRCKRIMDDYNAYSGFCWKELWKSIWLPESAFWHSPESLQLLEVMNQTLNNPAITLEVSNPEVSEFSEVKKIGETYYVKFKTFNIIKWSSMVFSAPDKNSGRNRPLHRKWKKASMPSSVPVMFLTTKRHSSSNQNANLLLHLLLIKHPGSLVPSMTIRRSRCFSQIYSCWTSTKGSTSNADAGKRSDRSTELLSAWGSCPVSNTSSANFQCWTLLFWRFRIHRLV